MARLNEFKPPHNLILIKYREKANFFSKKNQTNSEHSEFKNREVCCCHSRENGNPGPVDMIMDARLQLRA